MTTLNQFDLIRIWASDRNLIKGSNPHAQIVKMVEEFGETAGKIIRGDTDGIKDGIGDIIVCLTIISAQFGMDIEDCVAAAWDEIKDRKGRMENGIFIKECEE